MRLTSPNTKQFVFNSRTIFIQDFHNNTFQSEVGENSRLDLIYRITAYPGLFISNNPDTELTLQVVIIGANLSSQNLNSEQDFYQFQASLTANIIVKSSINLSNKTAKQFSRVVEGKSRKQASYSTLTELEKKSLFQSASLNLSENIFKAITKSF